MSKDNSPHNLPIFTGEEIALFWFELKSKFRDGVRSPVSILYISLMLTGVAWATWFIPSVNKSETSPETLGVYVIGFLVTVGLDALVSWKKNGEEKKYEQAISAVFIVISVVLIICASILSMKTPNEPNSTELASWKPWASQLLFLIFCVAVFMSLSLSGIDPKIVPIGPLDKSVASIEDRK
jgi:L-asparagine transporter-like permease